MTDPADGPIDEQIDYYRRRAGEYDATTTPPGDPLAPQAERLEAALHDFRPAGKVLELACGTGAWTRLLAGYADELTALDSSQEMLELNRAKVEDPGVRYVRADVFSWEPDERYEVVVFANWLSHVPPIRFELFWALVKKFLRAEGRVFFIDEATDAWRKEEWLTAEWSAEEPAGARPPAPLVRRVLEDGSAHRVIKVFWSPELLEARLEDLGWKARVRSTGAFYWGEARRAAPTLLP